MMTVVNGHCLCGSIAFSMDTPKHLDACHCKDCRRVGGGPFIGPEMSPITFTKKDTLTWYRSSDWAERGFCSKCGSSLFYRLVEAPENIGVTSGSLENLPEGLLLRQEYFIDQKPDYYEFSGKRKRLTGEEVFALYQGDGDA